jgi:F-type H+-transporting ATPase subunit O
VLILQLGVNFTIKYEVDPSILGGLQMYSGNKFMDCSLFSRV